MADRECLALRSSLEQSFKTREVGLIESARGKFRDAAVHFLLHDFVAAETIKLEDSLWNLCYYRLLQDIRKGQGGDAAILLNEAAGIYHFMLAALVGYHSTSVIQEGDTSRRLPSTGRGIFQGRCLIRLGDIARYRLEFTSTSSSGFNVVNTCQLYYYAAIKSPGTAGKAFNQLALIAVQEKSSLEALSYYMLSIVADPQLVLAQENLKSYWRHVDAALTSIDSGVDDKSLRFRPLEDLSLKFIRPFFKTADAKVNTAEVLNNFKTYQEKLSQAVRGGHASPQMASRTILLHIIVHITTWQRLAVQSSLSIKEQTESPLQGSQDEADLLLALLFAHAATLIQLANSLREPMVDIFPAISWFCHWLQQSFDLWSLNLASLVDQTSVSLSTPPETFWPSLVSFVNATIKHELAPSHSQVAPAAVAVPSRVMTSGRQRRARSDNGNDHADDSDHDEQSSHSSDSQSSRDLSIASASDDSDADEDAHSTGSSNADDSPSMSAGLVDTQLLQKYTRDFQETAPPEALLLAAFHSRRPLPRSMTSPTSLMLLKEIPAAVSAAWKRARIASMLTLAMKISQTMTTRQRQTRIEGFMPIMFDEQLGRFAHVPRPVDDPELRSQLRQQQQERLMKKMAEERLKVTVSSLENEVARMQRRSGPQRGNATPSVSTHVIVDTPILTGQLSLVKQLVASQQAILHISHQTVQDLDDLKRGSARENRNSREAIRFLERHLKRSSGFVKVHTAAGTLTSLHQFCSELARTSGIDGEVLLWTETAVVSTDKDASSTTDLSQEKWRMVGASEIAAIAARGDSGRDEEDMQPRSRERRRRRGQPRQSNRANS